MGFSVYDLLREAEGDEQEQTAASAETPADAPTDNPDAAGDDDNFDIDANLDDPDNPEGDPDNPDDPAAGGDDFDGDMGSGGNDTEEEDEPVEDNTDIFASLTAEEQQMKIMELKNQYGNLYDACMDLFEKVNKLDIDEDSVEFVNRINNTLFDLKKYIADYLTHTFAEKSFIENDIMFNRFLSIIQSINVAFDKFQKRMEQNVEDNVKN